MLIAAWVPVVYVPATRWVQAEVYLPSAYTGVVMAARDTQADSTLCHVQHADGVIEQYWRTDLELVSQQHAKVCRCGQPMSYQSFAARTISKEAVNLPANWPQPDKREQPMRVLHWIARETPASGENVMRHARHFYHNGGLSSMITTNAGEPFRVAETFGAQETDSTRDQFLVSLAVVHAGIKHAQRTRALERGLATSDSLQVAIHLYERLGFMRALVDDFHPYGAEMVQAYRLH